MNERNCPSMRRGGLILLLAVLLAACGGGGGGSDPAAGVGAGPGSTAGGGAGSGGTGGGNSGASAPAAPTGITATPGDAQVALIWSAATSATSYSVSRSTTSGGPYTSIGTPSMPSYTDSALTNGTTYYYVVSASNS